MQINALIRGDVTPYHKINKKKLRDNATKENNGQYL